MLRFERRGRSGPQLQDPVAAERRGRPPIIELDPRFYARQRDFDARFPAGAPSLLGCDRLEVRGDVVFGRDVVVAGRARDDGTIEVVSRDRRYPPRQYRAASPLAP